jgi:hypothetical protein
MEAALPIQRQKLIFTGNEKKVKQEERLIAIY